jgi:hypothetical protein
LPLLAVPETTLNCRRQVVASDQLAVAQAIVAPMPWPVDSFNLGLVSVVAALDLARTTSLAELERKIRCDDVSNSSWQGNRTRGEAELAQNNRLRITAQNIQPRATGVSALALMRGTAICAPARIASMPARSIASSPTTTACALIWSTSSAKSRT